MRSIIPSAAARSRSVMVAVVLGTALTAGSSRAATPTSKVARVAAQLDDAPDTIRDISRYCQACWRNARLPADKWDDCTQQVLVRLLERVDVGKWNLLMNETAEERREFVRAIDTVKKRTQRAKRFSDLSPEIRDDRNRAHDHVREQREAVELAANEVLSSRQQKIVELSADGWAVPDIAKELRTTPERVSDEKYKAIRKLRAHLGVDLEA